MRISKSHARGQHNYYHSQKVREREHPLSWRKCVGQRQTNWRQHHLVLYFVLKKVFLFSLLIFSIFFFVSPKTYPCVYCNCCLVVVLLSSRDGLTRSSLPFSKFVDFEFSSTRDDPIEFFFSLLYDQLLNIDIAATVCVLISLFTKCTSPQWIP